MRLCCICCRRKPFPKNAPQECRHGHKMDGMNSYIYIRMLEICDRKISSKHPTTNEIHLTWCCKLHVYLVFSYCFTVPPTSMLLFWPSKLLGTPCAPTWNPKTSLYVPNEGESSRIHDEHLKNPKWNWIIILMGSLTFFLRGPKFFPTLGRSSSDPSTWKDKESCWNFLGLLWLYLIIPVNKLFKQHSFEPLLFNQQTNCLNPPSPICNPCNPNVESPQNSGCLLKGVADLRVLKGLAFFCRHVHRDENEFPTIGNKQSSHWWHPHTAETPTLWVFFGSIHLSTIYHV